MKNDTVKVPSIRFETDNGFLASVFRDNKGEEKKFFIPQYLTTPDLITNPDNFYKNLIRKYAEVRAGLLLQGEIVVDEDIYQRTREPVLSRGFHVLEICDGEIVVGRVSSNSDGTTIYMVSPFTDTHEFEYRLTRCFGEAMHGGTRWITAQPLYSRVLSEIKGKLRSMYVERARSNKRIGHIIPALNTE